MLSTELMANKIYQKNMVKGVLLFGNEIKLSQFANDTNLICSDLPSVEDALQILDDFGNISGLRLNKEKNSSNVAGTIIRTCPILLAPSHESGLHSSIRSEKKLQSTYF